MQYFTERNEYRNYHLLDPIMGKAIEKPEKVDYNGIVILRLTIVVKLHYFLESIVYVMPRRML